MIIDRCPGCLRSAFNTYCSKCLKKLFNGKKIPHVLNFTRPEFNKIKREQSGRLSISGIQVKHSLRLIDDELTLTESKGEYILKPIPSGQFENLDQAPANENLTMQIARQVFKINTAENGLIFFRDGSAAYITKRFDLLPDGKKLLQEDFAQISGKTEEKDGENYKYDFSYEEIAEIMRKFIPAYSIEIEKFFTVVLFNYLFSNGDSHLKNFSLSRNEEYGDYLLTPFYDLLNTSLHTPGESDLALARQDFLEFSVKIGIRQNRFDKLFNGILKRDNEIEQLVQNSFLKEEAKKIYLKNFYNKSSRMS